MFYDKKDKKIRGPGHGSHFRGPGSQIPRNWLTIQDPGSQVSPIGASGPGSIFLVCQLQGVVYMNTAVTINNSPEKSTPQ